MASRIPDTLWARMALLLLTVALAGLSSGLLVRQLMVSDFRAYISGSTEDRSYWVLTRLEGKYAETGRWERDALADDIVWAYMTGLAVRLSDMERRPVMDLSQALERMSPAMRRRVAAYAGGTIRADFRGADTYPLFHRGEEVGQMEIVATDQGKERLFISHSNRLLTISLAVVGSLTLLLSFLLSRRIIRPVQRLTAAAQALREGETEIRVPREGTREFRLMAETFNRMAESLSAQERLRRKLLANAAHELRTPLTVIRLQVEQIADGMARATPERLAFIMGEIDRLSGILGALDSLSRAEASVLELQLRPIDLRPLLEPIVEHFASSAPGIDFRLELPGTILVSADPDRLSQIMINLISNAVRAVGESGWIVVRGSREGGQVLLRVEDSGCGIADEELPWIFERFYHGFREGSGIGLAVVRELAAAHGGSITADNGEKGGAVFTLRLPCDTS